MDPSTELFEVEAAAAATRRRLGQYMTPKRIADAVVSMLAQDPSRWRVVDPSCGDGSLLLAAARALQVAGAENVVERLSGIDIDPQMVELSRARLAKQLGCPTKDVRISQGDFLASALDPGVTAILANPPYGQSREYAFFERARLMADHGTELAFVLPLSFLDRAKGSFAAQALKGRPFGVTTGHAIVHHVAGEPFELKPVRRQPETDSPFTVLTGVKLYEVGAGVPPQSAEIARRKPFSRNEPRDGWLPCIRTGDIDPPQLRLDRLWVRYGEHLAHPKTIERFTGPKLFVRRVPIWKDRRLGAVYTDERVLCAGDVLVVRHREDDTAALRELCDWLNSAEAAGWVHSRRPSVVLRDSFPKISAKDLTALIDARGRSVDRKAA